MRHALLSLVCAAALAGCAGDETLHAYGAGGHTYALQSIDGVAFGERATLGFPEPGRVAGQGPCNAFTTAQTAPYPWLDLGPIAVTARACAALEAERAYLQALDAMSTAEVTGDTLLLADDSGREMVFTRISDG